MRRVIAAALVLAMAVGFPGLALAQAADTVYGTVPAAYRSGTGSNPAVSVSLVNSATGAVIATIPVGADGAFVFTSVPPASYIIRVNDSAGGLLTTSLTATLGAGSSELVRWGSDRVTGALPASGAGGGLSTTTIVIGSAAVLGLGVGIYYATKDSKAVSPSR
jgi:hypothetical protein